MPCWGGKRRIAVVTACLDAGGRPAFAINHADVTQREADLGVHHYLVEADLLEGGYQGPFVHFDEDEAPAFLHAAVCRHLGLPAHDVTTPVAR